ncbi:MAG: hypothetical protein VXV96_14885 [Bdellovibrionota bacterium]|nr:hypothetical protein [Bdellovibrionota bacterium]
MEENSFANALENLFLQKKEKSQTFSLQSFANRLGYKSKGHVSSLLKGEKRLPLEKCSHLKEVFNLNEADFSILYLLCTLDHSSSPNEKKVIRSQIRITRDHYSRAYLPELPADIDYTRFALVYCCIGLMKNPIFFPEEIAKITQLKIDDIVKILNTLIQYKAVEKVEDSYTLINTHLRIPNNAVAFAHEMTASLMESTKKFISSHFNDKENALFESSMISVKREEYILFLQRLNTFLNTELSQLESSDGNLIIIANAQVVPYLEIL